MKNVLRSHYLLWFGSLSGVLPFTSIFAREHVKASPSEIGLLYTLLPFVAFLTKPLVCGIADRFNGHKITLVVVMIATMIGFGSLVITPWLHAGPWSWWYFCACVMLANTAMGVGTTLTDSIVMREVTNGTTCYGSIRLWGTVGWGIFGLIAGGVNDNLFSGLPYLLPGLIMFLIIISISIVIISIRFKKESDASSKTQHEPDTARGRDIDQTEVACSSKMIQEAVRLEEKGRQGAETANISINENVSPNAGKVGSLEHEGLNSSPGICVAKIDVNGSRKKKSVAKGILRTFLQNPSLFHYCFIIFVVGFLSAFHWSFFFWFIEEIRGKDTLLMGLALVVQSFLGEIPFFLISHRILKKIGPSRCLTLTLGAFAVRFLSYGYLINSSNAYYVLVVELTQGPTFSLFYVVMTQLAQEYSIKSANSNKRQSISSLNPDPPHSSSNLDDSRVMAIDHLPPIAVGNTGVILESRTQPIPDNVEDSVYASMQGLMSGLYEGAGLGVGSLVAGFLIEHKSIEATWQLAGFIALVVACMNLLLDVNIGRCKGSKFHNDSIK